LRVGRGGGHTDHWRWCRWRDVFIDDSLDLEVHIGVILSGGNLNKDVFVVLHRGPFVFLNSSLGGTDFSLSHKVSKSRATSEICEGYADVIINDNVHADLEE
jgi:hypothetical protein